MIKNFFSRCRQVFFLVAFTCACPLIFAASSSPQPWKLIYGRFGAAVVSDGLALYVIGGGDSDRELGGIEKIDLKTGISIETTARIVSRRFHSAVLMGRTVYVFGGESNEGLIKSVDAVDLDTMKVTTVSKMPTPRRAVSAVGVEDLIFTLGGCAVGESSSDPRVKTVEVYDRSKNKWLAAPPMPEPKEVPALFLDHYLYTLGGYAGGAKAVPSCQRYNLSTGSWEALLPTPFTLSGYSAVSAGGLIFCFGDFVEDNRVAAYEPRTQRWRRLDVPFTPRRNSCACRVGENVYVIGGNGAKLAMNLIERFSVSALKSAAARADDVVR